MEQKKDIALSTKIILVGMSFVPVVFSGFLTYFNRIDAGDSVNDAFEAAFAVFIILLLTGIFAFCCVFAIAELIEQEQKSK
jgi:hypothetical protein